ncbi:hypothetical protein H113_00102 [Trichophyton rubrum MR1459]|uniref:CMP/dCMP-type deaminase domain-containing protein n=1 Tax=Trichophyton rubrum (strain ATCC MYA-4607 / CBS 118892) TaxID=559305 RepID=F2T163_TRIRC|nr:uncharacterized protein TERG_08550 [Trichophyton rubrum CBS 118892]EGD92335.2 hypothetical protein TERG_08550 [Trichophyton rubrum CBS 118892]EZG00421.1 hypothetical protein H113_00102 [Trichophyton rubrum MR1459]
MCASALRQYQIRSVYFGCANERFGGTGGVLTLHSESVLNIPNQTQQDSRLLQQCTVAANNYSSPAIDQPYPVYGGIYRKEAIMLLRKFYVQENENGEKVLSMSDK